MNGIIVHDFLRHPRAIGNDLILIEQWLATAEIIPLDSIMARRAAELGRTRKTKLPDLLIAATAIELGIPLITKNKKDFTGIPKLKIRTTV